MRAAVAHRGNGDAPIAGAQIDDPIARPDFSHFQHARHHAIGRRYVGNVQLTRLRLHHHDRE